MPPDAGLRTELFELQKRVRLSLLDEHDAAADAVAPDDPRVVFVLDALAALSASEPDDPAHAWARANLLATVGRHLEAAEEFLVARTRFESVAGADDAVTGDEVEWARAALYHAVKNLALGGHALGAAALLPRLEADDRDELRTLIEDVPLPAGAG